MLEEHRHWCPWITKSSSPSTSPITDGSPILPVKITAKTSAVSSSSTSSTAPSTAVQVDNITSSSSTDPKNAATSTSVNPQQARARSLLTNKQQMPGWKVVLITIFPALGRSVTSPTVSTFSITLSIVEMFYLNQLFVKLI